MLAVRITGQLLWAALAIGSCARPASAQGQAAAQPGLDCAQATSEVERAICSDSTLAAADARMARLYAQAQVSAFGRGPSNVPAEQLRWLAERNESCMTGDNEKRLHCLRYAIDERSSDLAVAALFREPALALETLHRLRPGWAPLVEAVYLYAIEPSGTDWNGAGMVSKRARLLALLEPYARRFVADEDLWYGRDILAELGAATAEDALKSDTSFAHFVNVTSVYVDSDSRPIMPCAAIVRHPDLLGATGPAFGSTLDNFVLDADCGETLPPTPQLAMLVERIWNGWPNCDGTIRFAAYRGFAQDVNRTRLATERDLTDGRPGRMRRLRGISSAEVEAVVAELGTYYRRYDRASDPTAPALARTMVHGMLESAHQCE